MSWQTSGFESLHGRLGAWLALAVVLCFAAAFVGAEHFIDSKLYQQFDESLSRRARLLSGLIAAERELRREISLPEFELAAHRDFFQVFARDGSTLLRSASSRGRDLAAPPDPGAATTWYDLVLPDAHAGRAVAVRIVNSEDARLAGAVLVVAEEVAELEALDNSIHIALLVCFAVSLLAVLAAGRLAIRAGLAPLESLRARVAQVRSPGPPVQLDSASQPRELRELVDSLQLALEGLHGTAERERRWARDLAHELRTPLAELRAVSEVGLAGGGDPRATLKTAADVAAELEEITDAMLAVTRYEAGVEAPAADPLDLAGALRRWTARAAETAGRRGLRFELDVPAELWVQADEQLLARIFANLAGNAVRHAPAGDVIRIRAAAGVDGARFELENQADHLAHGDLASLRERFFRRPAPGGGGVGSGLGLGVVEALARLAGSRLELDLRGDRFVAVLTGLRFLEVS